MQEHGSQDYPQDIVDQLEIYKSVVALIGETKTLSTLQRCKIIGAIPKQQTSFRYLYLYIGCTVASMILIYFAVIQFAEFCLAGEINLHNTMIGKLLRQRITFFDTTPRGRIENRISKDIDSIDSIIPQYFQDSMNAFVQVIGSIVAICALNWPSIFFAIPMLIIFVATYGYARQLSP